VEIEVGFGKGGWLIDAAQARPDHNFLGIEVVRALQLYVATRAAKRQLVNVRLACIDARHFLAQRVPPRSVTAIHVYFPDPWWKKRHKKRRVFTPEFAAAAEQALVLGGKLLIGTDVEEYFGVMTEIVALRPGFQQIDRRVQSGPAESSELLTNFERKARLKGRSVWRAAYVRVETPTPTDG
jgi:tRNA (guanine-N7-)-methyltransferase